MKILLNSYPFYPSIGGIESMSMTLAEEWIRQGHSVTVVTDTAAEGSETFAFPIVRRPDFRTLRRLVREHDVVFHNNISLSYIAAALVGRKPLVITHQTWIGEANAKQKLQGRLKRFFIGRATSIAISKAIAADIAPSSVVIGNAYDDQLFHEYADIAPSRDIVFVGRLVKDKGADVLVNALGELAKGQLRATVTIVGGGPELEPLKAQVQALKLENIEFTGPRRGEELARTIAGHRIMVVPSTWKEPFGIVALEGIACGCVVVGTEGGGLSDAIGEGGATFPNGDASALAKILADLLQNPTQMAKYRSAAAPHLDKHRPAAVASAYLRVFEQALGR